MDLQLDKKLALVTGSTAGIGFAIAQGLACEGAFTIVNGRTEERVKKAAASIREKCQGSKVEGFSGDLSTLEAVERLTSKFPDVDVLVNNLGIFAPQTFEQITDEDWVRFFEVNVLSGIRLARYYLPRMKAKNWGRIIFISSESAVQIPVEMIHYGMTKTAQLAISRGLAETTVGTGVTVNAVLPGPTASEGVKDFVDRLAKDNNTSPKEFEKMFFEKARPTNLLKRFAAPEEVASMVVYLCSPLSSATNGAALRVDGGTVRSIT
ncbi:MAG: SDR family oxidoreductase [Verrucomicrobia bacterium]|nr:SDR family oxidoreductase [Verrucomicrobiota bacterium]MBV9674638.1 SDR family oxidoreductase [Verrucomicrobiota bacterium]